MKKTEKIKESKSWFFEKINKIDKVLARLIKKKGKGLKSIKLEIKKEKPQQTHKKIQRIVRDYYKHLYANKMGNLKEMDKFVGRYHLPILNQKELENMNRPVTSPEIGTVI